MSRPDHLEQVKNRIKEADSGAVFIPSDFFDITTATKINTCLDRLENTGELQHIMRGVYAKPRFSELLKKTIPPRIDDVAKSIARNYGWTIVPFGDTALNILGLSTQVPAIWVYISDGPYKFYDTNGLQIRFKHTDNKNEIVHVSYKTALVVQAIKAIGRHKVESKIIRSISSVLSSTEKKQMLSEAMRVTAWVYEMIRKICEVGEE